MTVGKSGELKIACGGMEGLVIGVGWEERMDAAANASVLAVTSLTVDGGGRIGRIYINGTIGVNGSVIARLTDDAHWADITQFNVPAGEMNGAYPFASQSVSHNADGTGTAVLTVQLSGTYGESGQHYYAAGEVSLSLTDFSRVSTVAAASGEIGVPMTVVITAPVSDCLHSLRYVCGDASGTIGSGLSAGTHVWTPPMELCAAITDSTVGTCTILCDTYRGESLMGSAECTVNVSVPFGVGLTAADGWVTVQAENSGTAAEGLDCCVQGISRVRVVIDERLLSDENAFGAAPAGYTVTVGGVVCEEPYLSEVLHTAGKVAVGCTVTDTRGRRIREVQTIEVMTYGPPVIGTASVFRCTEDGTADDAGTCISVTASCRRSSLGGRNRVTLSAWLQPVGGERSEAVTLTDGETAVLWAGTVSPAQTYEVGLDAVDSLGGIASLRFMIPTAKVFFHGRSGGSGGAFGKYAETDDLLEVAWSLKTKGDLTVEGSAVIGGKSLLDWLYPVGAVFTGSADADPAALFGGTWAAAEDAVQRWVRTE